MNSGSRPSSENFECGSINPCTHPSMQHIDIKQSCGAYIDLSEKLKSWISDEVSREFEGIVCSSRALADVLELVRVVAPTDATVLIEGETGVGKELVANAIHRKSNRRSGPLVNVNCAAIPHTLLESELFGHEKGAFTGAVMQKLGRFEMANGGTLFLDEIGDMPLDLQAKLLRVLQEQQFERVGSSHTQRVDVRVVAATNQELRNRVAQKQFRMDLFYRLNVFPITVPPLREREDDIPLLVAYFVHRYSQRMAKSISKVSLEGMDKLRSYGWPGNIRELQNYIERAVILSKTSILQLPMLQCCVPGATKPVTLQEAERSYILQALHDSNWVISGPSGAARRLGLPRSTLTDKIRKHGISRETFRRRQSVAPSDGRSETHSTGTE
jgi:formate hydrogenlyase transcriptional activator